MKKQKRQKVYAFIDSQNLNLGTSKDIFWNRKLIYRGWKLDFEKFRIYLSDKYHISKAFLFIGYLPQNRNLYRKLEAYGYNLVFKPTVRNSEGKPKGNVDAELIVSVMKYIYEKTYDKAVIVSGDGDFAVLADFLLEKQKLAGFIVPNRLTMSLLIKKIFLKRDKFVLLGSLNNEKEKLAIKKPLYRSGNR